jgi:hypothetical protein
MNVAPNDLIYLLANFDIFHRNVAIFPELIFFLCTWDKVKQISEFFSFYKWARPANPTHVACWPVNLHRLCSPPVSGPLSLVSPPLSLSLSLSHGPSMSASECSFPKFRRALALSGQPRATQILLVLRNTKSNLGTKPLP